jgi:hypothetical protein
MNQHEAPLTSTNDTAPQGRPQRCPACGFEGMVSIGFQAPGAPITFLTCMDCTRTQWTTPGTEVPAQEAQRRVAAIRNATTSPANKRGRGRHAVNAAERSHGPSATRDPYGHLGTVPATQVSGRVQDS